MYDIILGRDEEDRKKYGTEGTIFIGKHYVKMGQITSLSNKIYMDVAKSHVVFICGKRGSGKCLHGDTLITLDNGLELPIKQLFANNEDVMALNHQLKLTNSKKTAFYTRKVDKLLYIKLRSGKELKLTPEHEVKILAYLIAEGHIKKSLFFTNYDYSISDELKNCLELIDKSIELVP